MIQVILEDEEAFHKIVNSLCSNSGYAPREPAVTLPANAECSNVRHYVVLDTPDNIQKWKEARRALNHSE